MVALRVSHESLQFMMVFKAGSTFTFHSWFCEVEMYIFVELESQKDNYLHVQYGPYGYFQIKVLFSFVTLTLSRDHLGARGRERRETDIMTVTLANKALMARLAKW